MFAMDFKKIILYGLAFFLAMTLWSKWQEQTQVTSKVQTASSAQKNQPIANPVLADQWVVDTIPRERLVTVETPLMHLSIDKLGGTIVSAQLMKYDKNLEKPEQPLALLSHEQPETLYVAQSGLHQREDNPILYTTTTDDYQMGNDQNKLTIQLTARNVDGVDIVKTFTVDATNYLVSIHNEVINHSAKPWQGQFYYQLMRRPPVEKKSMFQVSSYTGASFSDPLEKKYNKLSFSSMEKEPLKRNVKGGWIAMQQHYFLSAFIPKETQYNHFYSQTSMDGLYRIGLLTPLFRVQPGDRSDNSVDLYLGPEILETLKAISPGLDMTIDYGWLWFISSFLFWLLKNIYDFIGNWGWSIVILTLLVKVAFYNLSAKSYRSMAKLKKLQPKIEALKKRCGEDKQKMGQSLMELYRTEKVNPLGGCLPILIQIPVFIALYWVLLESVELRHAPFILWIHDLTAPDPYFVLPVLMGLTMFIQQKLNPPPADPTQAKVMMFLPVLFTGLFLYFSSGLVLYWTVNNLLSIAQQWYISRKLS